MFYSADKEWKRPKRRASWKRQSNLLVSDEMEIGLENLDRNWAKDTQSKSLEMAYPDFSGLSESEILDIAEHFEAGQSSPQAKRLRTSASPKPDNEIPSSNTDMGASSVRSDQVLAFTWEQLIQLAPEIEQFFQEQQTKLRQSKVSLEFVHEIPKNERKPIFSLPATTNSASDSNMPSRPSIANSFFAMDPTLGQTENRAPVGGKPSDYAEQAGSSLLAGIDDLFGDKKKGTRPKPKRPR